MSAGIPSAAAMFRLRGWDGSDRPGSSAAVSAAVPVVNTASSTGPATGQKGLAKFWDPRHELFYIGAMLAGGLALFGYATERGVGVRASGHVGGASAEAGAEIGG